METYVIHVENDIVITESRKSYEHQLCNVDISQSELMRFSIGLCRDSRSEFVVDNVLNFR